MNLHLSSSLELSRKQRRRANLAILSAGLLLFSLFCLLSALGLAAPENAGAQAAAKLWMEDPGVQLLAGTSFELRFHAGSASEPVSRLFGLAFELHYSSDAYLEFVPPVQAQQGPFLLPDVYTFTRHEADKRVLYLAVSRKRGAPGRSGDGIALTLPLRFADDAPPDWEVCFEIRNVAANDSAGNPLPVEAGSRLCLKVIEPAVEVVPNPFTPNEDGFNDATEFVRDGGIPPDWVILIMERTGHVIRRLTNGQQAWDGRDEQGIPMLPGPYLYTIKDGERIVKRGVLGIIR